VVELVSAAFQHTHSTTHTDTQSDTHINTHTHSITHIQYHTHTQAHTLIHSIDIHSRRHTDRQTNMIHIKCAVFTTDHDKRYCMLVIVVASYTHVDSNSHDTR
jgi:hypothetical protein